VYVYDTRTGTLVRRSLAARGVKVVDSLTWLSSTKLLVAGRSTKGDAFYPVADRLYVLNALTGVSARYRGLSGTEPSVAPAAGRLVYVRFSQGGRMTNWMSAHWITERLYRVKLAAGARPHLLASATYADDMGIHLFHDPRLSPSGAYVITSTTGSDISVNYRVRSAATGKVRRTVSTELLGNDVTAWSNQGDRVALWSMPLADNTNTTQLLVYNPAGNVLRGSAKLSKVVVTGLAWSSNDALLAYSLRGFISPDDAAELWTIDPASLSSSVPTDLGAGSMPVFVP
jgi:hypothetical protein